MDSLLPATSPCPLECIGLSTPNPFVPLSLLQSLLTQTQARDRPQSDRCGELGIQSKVPLKFRVV